MKPPPKKGHQHDREAPEHPEKVQQPPAQFGRHNRLVPRTTHVRKQGGGKH